MYSKFEELEWLQQLRISQGRSNSNPQSQWVQETSPEIKSRNRYRDVQAWANNRIHLKVPEGHCDYINASPISLHNSKTGKEERYIATQVQDTTLQLLQQITKPPDRLGPDEGSAKSHLAYGMARDH